MLQKCKERGYIGISMGEPAGIGAEICVKALNHREIYDTCIPIVVGDRAAMEDALAMTNSALTLHPISDPDEALGEYGVIDYVDLGLLTSGSWRYKQNSVLGGRASYAYIQHAAQWAMDGKTDAIVTGPISKDSLRMAGYPFSGHTEILGHLTDTKDFAMLLISGSLRIIHVTTHVSMRDACDLITKERVYRVIRLANEGAQLLGLRSPRIGVAGFNPHCSENGLFGDQEAKAIIPAIAKAADEGLNVDGPVPPDTVFVKALAGQYDIVVAMYHDQGHIPLKLSGFKLELATGQYTSLSGVNCTIGLPIIRTSVDHGTAYGRAGEGRANEESMLEAIALAVAMKKNRDV